MHMLRLSLLLLPLLTQIQCLTPTTEYARVAPGLWRGVIELDTYRVQVQDKDSVFILYDQFKEGDLPFNFEVVYLDGERMVFDFINGQERIRCDSIQYGRDRSQARDTFNIFFPEYQAYLHAEVRGGAMRGYWELTTRKDYRLPFKATAGRAYRFTALNKPPAADLSGTWATHFGLEKDAPPSRALGEFKQTGNRMEGTFRTETGDYGFLEGTVQGDRFWMSSFDGSHAYLFSGAIDGDTLLGEFRSGIHLRSLWKAWKDPAFTLRHPDSLTALVPGAPPLSFQCLTPEGDTVRHPDPAYTDKVNIITISGTWCPNCKDELVFLRDFMQAHPDLAANMRVVSLSFERGTDPTTIQRHLQRYRQKLDLPFPVVYAGPADAASASKVFPQLNQVMAFPTMMVLDRNNQVHKIHTGFDGPATSRYEAFRSDFERTIRGLVGAKAVN